MHKTVTHVGQEWSQITRYTLNGLEPLRGSGGGRESEKETGIKEMNAVKNKNKTSVGASRGL